MKVMGVCAALALTLSAAVPAQAAEAAVWAFVYADPAGVEEQGAATVSWEASAGVTVGVTRGGTGDYQVRLDGIVSGAANGVPVVTAASGGGRHCQVGTFTSAGSVEVIDVDCYDGVQRADSAFTLTFFSSVGADSQPLTGAYGYVASDRAASYNSAGGGVTITPDGSRAWKVRFAGGTFDNDGGNPQVTGVGTQPVRCAVISWAKYTGGVEVRVRCDKLTNTSVAPQWTLMYAHERSIIGKPTGIFGYLQAEKPSEAEYQPDIRRNRGPNGQIHTVTRGDPGQYHVEVHGSLKLPVTIHVSAGGDSQSFCVPTHWEVLVAEEPEDPTGRVDVSCYNANGDSADSVFMLNYYSPRPLP